MRHRTSTVQYAAALMHSSDRDQFVPSRSYREPFMVFPMVHEINLLLLLSLDSLVVIEK